MEGDNFSRYVVLYNNCVKSRNQQEHSATRYTNIFAILLIQIKCERCGDEPMPSVLRPVTQSTERYSQMRFKGDSSKEIPSSIILPVVSDVGDMLQINQILLKDIESQAGQWSKPCGFVISLVNDRFDPMGS